MARLAFYAPMKPPDHPVVSGDRQMARALIAALGAGGHRVDVASRFTSRDGKGDPERQAELIAAAEAEVDRVTDALRDSGFAAWITYHSYYKAPDLIGPAVCARLGLPYLLIEATRARKRLTGPWAQFAARAEAACDAANTIFHLTERDGEALLRDRPDRQRVVHLRPFLPQAELPPVPSRGPDAPVLCAGMMRPGDKFESYRLIAQTLALIPTGTPVEVAGDGPARPQVEALLGDRARFLGALSAEEMAAAYARAALFLWPGVNEAFGMVYLEAQAAGLPVVAQDRPGVREVLEPGNYPAVDAGAAGLARHVNALLADPTARAAQGAAAVRHIREYHLIGSAVTTLNSELSRFVGAPT
ncbi:glycosyltransferase family 4 protein [Arenibacterium halophilum]|nr:glycosyltransferase family 4 protein [Arenibacterium halophilum]